VPLYEYECRPHAHRFEVRHGINENPVESCPECGGEVRRVIHPVGIVFKGSGFYATDSRKAASSTKPAGESKTDSKEKAGTTTDSTSKSDSASSGSSSEAKSAG
jgi:putative FmdB family regulatory protein